MIAVLNRATKAAIQASKAGRVKVAQEAVIQETRDNRVERTVVISKVSKAGKVNKAGHRIAIAKNKKATCLIVIASRASKASRKKLLQAVTPHHITMTRIQNAQKTTLQTGIRILTAA